MTGRLTTHVLDTAAGVPAAGIRVWLYRYENGPVGPKTSLASATTNVDGRSDAPLLAGPDFRSGSYCIEFGAGAYLESVHGSDAKTFFDIIPVNFRVDDASRHYHVPLLLSPFGYSTYRGS